MTVRPDLTEAPRAVAGPADPARTDFDVLIVGAGISGIDAAHHLLEARPGTSFALIERQGDIGGTWRTHRFPGARSDSDLYTFGFGWKPWTGPELATADEILSYLNEAVEEMALRPHIRFGRSLVSAAWDSAAARWTLTVARLDGGPAETLTARFLWMCQGYYRHEAPYVPDWPGMERFAGPIVHPQDWPEDLDCAGKRVTVIGSGATAATLVPALAEGGAQVTMLQRSPTWFLPTPKENDLAALLRPLNLPDAWFHEIMRRQMLHLQGEVQRRAREAPEGLEAELLGAAEAYLGGAAPLDPHFRPTYHVWRQRLARIPDGDLFRAVRAGTARVVTDRIETFTETGLALESGAALEADVIVTATGFDLCVMGDVGFSVDGAPVDWAGTVTYRGMMFSGVPNLVWVFGYLRNSWTLRADLISAWVVRALGRMAETGAVSVTPEAPEGMALSPFFDPEDFGPGYVMRALHLLPRQGDREPWRNCQDYYREAETIPAASLEEPGLVWR